MDYSDYLKSEEWRIRRNKIISAYSKCQRCGCPSCLRVHHKHYESVGNEKYSDVCLLCNDCHVEYHERFGKRPTPFTTDRFILEKNVSYSPGPRRKILGTKIEKPKKARIRNRKAKDSKPKKMRKMEKEIAKSQRYNGKTFTRQATKEDLARFGYSTK